MAVCFRKLRYRMVDEKIRMNRLIKMAGISDCAARRLGRDKDVSTEVLTKVCAALDCEVQDIVDFLP